MHIVKKNGVVTLEGENDKETEHLDEMAMAGMKVTVAKHPSWQPPRVAKPDKPFSDVEPWKTAEDTIESPVDMEPEAVAVEEEPPKAKAKHSKK